MSLDYKTIKTPRQWKALIGLSEQQFIYLSKQFGEVYEEKEGISLEKGIENLNKNNELLNSYESCLYFVLFQLKQNLTFDVLGYFLGTNHSNASRNFKKYLIILENVLLKLDMLPERKFVNAEDFADKLEKHIDVEKGIIIDGTEHTTYRASGYENQKEMYSGKKKHIPTKKL